jgi:HlyD family secretion protein
MQATAHSNERSATSRLPRLDNGKGATDSAKPRRKAGRFSRVAVALLLILAGGVGGMYFQGPGLRAFFAVTGLEPGAGAAAPIARPVQLMPSPERVASMTTGDVVALGRLRPQDDIVTVAAPFGTGDARVEQLLVAEGDTVEKGELLAVLDSQDKYESALSNARTSLAASRALLTQTISQVAAAEAETRASLESARVAAENAEASLRRIRSLYASRVTSAEDVDAAESTAAAARGDVERLRATLSRYQAGPGGVQADIAVAEADVESAEAAFAQAERDLDLARVHAPRAGTILDIAVREGEKVPTDGLLQLGNVEHMEAELEVFQSMAPRVSVGQRVAITSEVLGDEALTGTVSRVGLLVGRQSVTADDPAANTDARVVPVVVRLDGPSSERASRFVGLEVVGRIEVPASMAVVASAR